MPRIVRLIIEDDEFRKMKENPTNVMLTDSAVIEKSAGFSCKVKQVLWSVDPKTFPVAICPECLKASDLDTWPREYINEEVSIAYCPSCFHPAVLERGRKTL